MILKTVRFKNFFSYGNNFTEINLDKNSTTLLIGKNGAGKSVVGDAILFALFGKPFKKVNKGLMVNSTTEKNLVVELELSIGTKEYKIVRGIKPNIFEIYCDNEIIPQEGDVSAYQTTLEKIIGTNYKTACQVIFLGAASYVPFMELKPQERREIVEDILDLQIFSSMRDVTRNKLNINYQDIKNIESEKRIVSEKISIITQHIEESKKNNDEMIKSKNDLIFAINKNIQKETDYIEEIKSRVKLISFDPEQLKLIEDKLREFEKLRYSVKHKIDATEKELSFYHKNDDCPVCKQNISTKFKTETINNHQSLINSSKENLIKLEEKIEKYQTRKITIEKEKDTINDLKHELKLSKNKLENFINSKNTLKQDIEQLNRKSIVKDASKIDDLKNEIINLDKKYNDFKSERTLLEASAVLLKDGGIKAKIISQYVPIINSLINEYLSTMNFIVNFELNEEFEETIKSQGRSEFSYYSFSQGEKLRINLALLFAWRKLAQMRNSLNCNLLLMDETFDSSLDDDGMDQLLKIIKDLTKHENCFIISHRGEDLIDKFDHVIEFEKYKNFSRIKNIND